MQPLFEDSIGSGMDPGLPTRLPTCGSIPVGFNQALVAPSLARIVWFKVADANLQRSFVLE